MLARIAHTGGELGRRVGKRGRIDQSIELSIELKGECRRQGVKGHPPKLV
jgi:hypothetical protein